MQYYLDSIEQSELIEITNYTEHENKILFPVGLKTWDFYKEPFILMDAEDIEAVESVDFNYCGNIFQSLTKEQLLIENNKIILNFWFRENPIPSVSCPYGSVFITVNFTSIKPCKLFMTAILVSKPLNTINFKLGSEPILFRYRDGYIEKKY